MVMVHGETWHVHPVLNQLPMFVMDPVEEMNTFVLYIHAEDKWFIRDVTGMSLYVLIKAQRIVEQFCVVFVYWLIGTICNWYQGKVRMLDQNLSSSPC